MFRIIIVNLILKKNIISLYNRYLKDSFKIYKMLSKSDYYNKYTRFKTIHKIFLSESIYNYYFLLILAILNGFKKVF